MKTTESPIRADAARNAERIMRAARGVFSEVGPHASLEEIAARAGVGARTLYRHFPSRDELVKAVLAQCIREDVEPKIHLAVSNPDPRLGLAEVLTAATDMVAREESIVAAARDALVPTAQAARAITSALAVLLSRGQATGHFRADVSQGDLFAFLAMLSSVRWDRGVAGSAANRIIALLLDSLRPEGAAHLPQFTTDDCQIPQAGSQA